MENQSFDHDGDKGEVGSEGLMATAINYPAMLGESTLQMGKLRTINAYVVCVDGVMAEQAHLEFCHRCPSLFVAAALGLAAVG